MRTQRQFLSLLAALLLTASVVACAPSLYDFHDQILAPLARQQADEQAEQNRLHIRRAFEHAKRLSNDRWYNYVYWGLDALGFAGYGMPGQGRLLETLKELYAHSSHNNREALLNAVLAQIDEERITDRQLILNDFTKHTSQELAFYGRIYAVCVDGMARRYRGRGHAFTRLEDKPC